MERRHALKILGALAFTACAPATVESRPASAPPGGQRIELPIASENETVKNMSRTVAEAILAQNPNVVLNFYLNRNPRLVEDVIATVRGWSECKGRTIKGINIRDDNTLGPMNPMKVASVSLDQTCNVFWSLDYNLVSPTKVLSSGIGIAWSKHTDSKYYIVGFVPQ